MNRGYKIIIVGICIVVTNFFIESIYDNVVIASRPPIPFENGIFDPPPMGAIDYIFQILFRASSFIFLGGLGIIVAGMAIFIHDRKKTRFL